MSRRRVQIIVAASFISFAGVLTLAASATSQVSYPPAAVDTSKLATKAEVTAVQASIPTPSATVPPSVADSGAVGTMNAVYALANHTHASKARKGRVLVPATGTLAVTFSPAFSGVPVCATTAETTAGDTNVVNAQIDGQPTASGMTLRVTRTQISVAQLLGLSILSVPTQVATYTHYVCVEP